MHSAPGIRTLRRSILASMLALGALAAMAGIAAADSPDPASIVAVTDGRTVTLSGTWAWPGRSAPCGPGTSTNRAAGWAADWGDGFAGNLVPRKDLPATAALHMGGATDNAVRVSGANNGLGDCGTAAPGGGVAGSWGPISHTYAAPGTYAACIVTYDVRYTTSGGAIFPRDRYQLVAGGSGRNRDNSAETNPASGKYGAQVACVTVEIIDPAPELTLIKSATETDYDTVGDVIDYTFTVENTGNVPLAGPVTIDDDLTSDEACPALTTVGDLDADLDVGESVECTASYTITQADLDAGSVRNMATASADGTTSNEDSATVDAIADPRLALEKIADVAEVTAVGDVIAYTFTVTNTGNITLAAPVSIADPLVPEVSCPDLFAGGDGKLAPEESTICTGSYTVTQADLDAGSVTNTATATADGATSDEDSVVVDVIADRDLGLAKTADVDEVDAVGDVITYTFTVTNTGNVSVAGPVTIDDPLTDDETCPAVTTLAPAATLVFSGTYTVTQADLDAGGITNTATATADGVTSPPDTVIVDAIADPRLALVKASTASAYRVAGDIIGYTFTVTNTGNVGLAGPVTIEDDRTSDESCPALATVGDNDGDLDPGETIVCSATYTVTAADVTRGFVENTATARADGIDSAPDSVTVERVEGPALGLAKEVVEEEFGRTEGARIGYTFTVTNTGDRPVAGPVAIDDPLTADETCPDLVTVGDNDGDLDPGETIVCTASYAITTGDILAGVVRNRAVARAGDLVSNESRAVIREAPVILFILDASASISSRTATTIERYNTLLRRFKSETRIAPYSLVLFSTEFYRERYTDRRISTVPALTRNTFVPRGATPLYDAATRAIRDLEARGPVGPVTIVIMTDGQDNSSTTATARSLARLIRRKEADGWKFVYEGARLAALEAAVARLR